MTRKYAVRLMLIAQLVTAVAWAQEAEFGRASGGDVQLLAKTPKNFSGSLGAMFSNSNSPFSLGPGYEATLGGSLIQDRLFFFVAGQRYNSTHLGSLQMPDQAVSKVTGSLDAKMTAQLGDRQTLTGFLDKSQMPLLTTTGALVVPSTFLNMHYTGIVSDNMFFTANFTESGLRP